MLPGAHALQALTPKDLLTIRRGSCVRHRFAKSDCRKCFDICPKQALEWNEDGLHWDNSKCTGCFLCSSACSSGALVPSEVSLVGLVQELKDIEQPIIACHAKPATKGHARVPCLGMLANVELLLGVSLALGKEIGLNLSACAECQNLAVIQQLVRTVQSLKKLPESERVSPNLIFDAETLNFNERTCSRREFFTLLRKRSARAGSCIADRLLADNTSETYGKKRLPPTRRFLLNVLQHVPEQKQRLVHALFPERIIAADCRFCTGCVGICPTGAISPPEEPDLPPSFVEEKCISCQLCEYFCSGSHIQIKQTG